MACLVTEIDGLKYLVINLYLGYYNINPVGSGYFLIHYVTYFYGYLDEDDASNTQPSLNHKLKIRYVTSPYNLRHLSTP